MFHSPLCYLHFVQLVLEFRFKLLNDNQGERFKGLKGGAMSEARQWAIDFWDNIEHTSGYRAKRGSYHYNDYDNNPGKAENLSDIDA